MSLASLPEVRALREVPVATAAQMAEVDRITSEELGVSLEALMERACRQIARCVELLCESVRGRRIVAVAGPGNNGGDALGALRYLHEGGASVEAVVASPRERLRPLARRQYDALAALGVTVRDSVTVTDDAFVQDYERVDVLIDGLLGYSASGAPRGEVARLIHVANVARGYGIRPIVAVDLPSGIDPDTGARLSDAPAGAIAATLTVTLGLPKAGLVGETARRCVGELVLADIGIPPRAFERVGIDTRYVFERDDLLRVVS